MSDKFRKIGAWAGIVILLGIYVTTLVSAILQKESMGGLFIASLYCTFVVPVWIFVLQAIYNRTHKDAVGKAELMKMKKEAKNEDGAVEAADERDEDREAEEADERDEDSVAEAAGERDEDGAEERDEDGAEKRDEVEAEKRDEVEEDEEETME